MVNTNTLRASNMYIRVVPDTDLAGYLAAGYPANNFAGRPAGYPVQP